MSNRQLHSCGTPLKGWPTRLPQLRVTVGRGRVALPPGGISAPPYGGTHYPRCATVPRAGVKVVLASLASTLTPWGPAVTGSQPDEAGPRRASSRPPDPSRDPRNLLAMSSIALDELTELVVIAVRKHPDGITRVRLRRLIPFGQQPIATRAIESALAAGRVFEGTAYVRAQGGSMRSCRMLTPRRSRAHRPLDAEEFARRRATSGLTQLAIALELGVSHVLVSHWENGRQKIPEWAVPRINEAFRRAPRILRAERERREVMAVPSGPQLKALRLRAGLTVEEVGLRVGRSAATVRGWERGACVPGELRSALMGALGEPRQIPA